MVVQLAEVVLLDKRLEPDAESASGQLWFGDRGSVEAPGLEGRIGKPYNSSRLVSTDTLPGLSLASWYPSSFAKTVASFSSHAASLCFNVSDRVLFSFCTVGGECQPWKRPVRDRIPSDGRSLRLVTFSLLLSRCSSRHSFSSFSFSVTVLVSSVRFVSFSFCRVSPRYLFFWVSRSIRLMSASSSLDLRRRKSILSVGSPIFAICCMRSLFARLTSLSSAQWSATGTS